MNTDLVDDAMNQSSLSSLDLATETETFQTMSITNKITVISVTTNTKVANGLATAVTCLGLLLKCF